MGYTSAECDDCKIDVTGTMYKTGYDGEVWCDACHSVNRIADLERQIKSQMEWLEATHLKRVEDWRAEIIQLKMGGK